MVHHDVEPWTHESIHKYHGFQIVSMRIHKFPMRIWTSGVRIDPEDHWVCHIFLFSSCLGMYFAIFSTATTDIENWFPYLECPTMGLHFHIWKVT